MQNPSYLIKSRHDIYYFRYPLSVNTHKKPKRLAISLQTRCPKEALRLAKVLEYHTGKIIDNIRITPMNYSEITTILKTHYAALLEKHSQGIDEHGAIPTSKVEAYNRVIEELNNYIDEDVDSFEEYYDIELAPDDDSSIHTKLFKIMEKQGVSFGRDSKEYAMMKKALKFAERNYLQDVLSYSDDTINYTLLGKTEAHQDAQSNHSSPEYTLGQVMAGYLKELRGNLDDDRSFDDQKDCLQYIIEALGEGFLVKDIDIEQVQDIKNKLIVTPKNRNRIKLTREHSLLEQISIAKDNHLDKLSSTSVNKYLGYFSSLFEWAKRNKYISENPFQGIRVKNNKKENRRDMFNKDEVSLIYKEITSNAGKLIKNKSQYWGTLIAVYTGARRNEIAALMIDDIKQDKETGIWYFNISDELEEGKKLKTEAANRIVPIHSKLIELGFLDYCKEAKEHVKSASQINGMETRLLHDFTYTKRDKWGRKLGQFVNNKLLPYLNIHVKNKKTLHSLRHSFITYLDVADVKPEAIKSMVGHEQGTVTFGVYTHYGLDHLPKFKEAIEKLAY